MCRGWSCQSPHLGSVPQIASDGLKGRVFEVSLADLNNDEDQAFRKMKLRAEDVQGKNVLTNFYVSADLFGDGLSTLKVAEDLVYCTYVWLQRFLCRPWTCSL